MPCSRGCVVADAATIDRTGPARQVVVLPLPLPPWPPLPGVNGRSDLQALSAAWPAEVDCSSLNRLLKPPPEADGLGRVTPCADRQLSNLPNAALNPPDPPDPPNPPDGRSEAQA